MILLAEELNTQNSDRNSKTAILDTLKFLFREHPDPGIHSACEWALQRSESSELVSQCLAELTPAKLSSERSWFATPLGTTMAVFRGLVEFRSGSEWTDPDRLAHQLVNPVTGRVTSTDQEPLLDRIIDRDFAVGTKEVSLRDFLRFDASFHERVKQSTSVTMDHPANRVNWYLAAEYCNWLSRTEGIEPSQWCFIPNKDGRYAEGMTLAEDYLQRTGYRMPTEAEWEYVCRAGTATPRFFGYCTELMPQFVWFRDNSREKALIVSGTLKPNGFGMFDAFGNVIEWCVDPYEGRPGPQTERVPDRERGLTVDADAWRIMRGGHLYADANNIRASDLWTFRPLVADGHYGLRLARTINRSDQP